MKKTLLSALLCAAMLLPLASRAQTASTVAVGEDITSSANGVINFRSNFNYSQHIYLSSELISGDIVGLTFPFYSLPSSYYNKDNVSIYLGVTPDDSFEADSTGNRWKSPVWHLVYTGSVFSRSFSVTFDSAFHYTRSMGNLLVAVEDSSRVRSSNGTSYWVHYTPNVIRSIWTADHNSPIGNDNCFSHPTTVLTYNYDNTRPCLRLNIIPCNSFTEIYDTIGSGQTYTFHGQELSASGTYRDTLVGGAEGGCDSIVYLYLTCLDTLLQRHTLALSTSQGGTLLGAGTYAHGSCATLSAVADSGWLFQRWSDGNTQNPRTFRVTHDTVLQATFLPTLAVPEPLHDTLTLRDTLYYPLRDTLYLPLFGHDTIYLPQYIYDTLTVEVHDTVYFPQYIHDTIYITQEGTPLVESPSLNVYPNPCTNHLNVEMDFSTSHPIEVYDMQGRLVLREAPTTSNFTLQTSHLSPGTYLLRTGNHVRKFVKQ